MVEFVDGSVIAQAAIPDMRGPIQYALTAPRRRPGLVRPMEWDGVTLTFEVPEAERFPSLAVAREALRVGGTMPTALNAANEVAVERFLDRGIGFVEIVETVRAVLGRHLAQPVDSLDAVLRADAWARREADRRLDTVR
jgi:1-deoxy-D-xylulose-5-phosphate reductoisomerase